MTGRLIRRLILIALILTPVFGLQHWLRIFPGLEMSLGISSQVVVIKVAKDVLLFLILLLFLLDVMGGRPILYDPVVSFLVTLLTISFVVTAVESDPVLALIGLRGLSPFILVFIAYNYLDMTHVRSMVKVLVFLLLLELCAACVRARYGAAIHGSMYFGLAARPSGTFAAPASWSVFLCFIACYLLGSDIHRFGCPSRQTWCLVTIAALLVFLAASGTGVLALTVLLLCYFLFFSKMHPYVKASILPMLLLMICIVGGYLHVVTGRAMIYRSLGIRLHILSDVFFSGGPMDILIGKGLGIGSNVAVTFTKLNPLALGSPDSVFIADSLYASLMAQMGIVFLIAFVLLNVCVFRRAIAERNSGINPIALLVIPVALVGGCGNVLTEVFPVNWLLFMMYGMALKQGKTQAYDKVRGSHCDWVPSVQTEGIA